LHTGIVRASQRRQDPVGLEQARLGIVETPDSDQRLATGERGDAGSE